MGAHHPSRKARRMTPREATYATIRTVAETHGLHLGDLLGPNTRRSIARPRQAAYAAVKATYPHLSITQIGRTFNRDHTTILHGIARHETRMAWADFLRWAGNVEQPDLFARAA